MESIVQVQSTWLSDHRDFKRWTTNCHGSCSMNFLSVFFGTVCPCHNMTDAKDCFLCQQSTDSKNVWIDTFNALCKQVGKTHMTVLVRMARDLYTTKIRDYLPGKPDWTAANIAAHLSGEHVISQM